MSTTQAVNLGVLPTLRTLGTVGLQAADGTTLLPPGKPLGLLIYLRGSPGRTATRDHLLHTLWADVSEKRARHALKQTTWSLRQQLGDEAILVGADGLTLAMPIQSDRQTFVDAIEAGRLADAVSAYTGDFLPSFSFPGGLEFEHWAEGEREHLRRLFRRAAESLALDHLKQGHLRQARELAQRMRDADPFDETGWRLVLEASLALEDRVSALAEAQRLEDLLNAEGRDPEPATRAMLARVRVQPDVADEPGAALLAELVGREREFAALLSAFEAARRGPARFVSVIAPAGMGKTRLLQDVAHRLGAGGSAASTFGLILVIVTSQGHM